MVLVAFLERADGCSVRTARGEMRAQASWPRVPLRLSTGGARASGATMSRWLSPYPAAARSFFASAWKTLLRQYSASSMPVGNQRLPSDTLRM